MQPIPNPPARRSWLTPLMGLLTGLLLSISAQAQQSGQPLRIGMSTSNGPPFVYWQDGAAMDGLDVELARAIAQQMQGKAELIALPRARLDIAMAAGQLDLICHFNPQWVKDPGSLHWSPPLFDLQEVLAGHLSAPPVDRLDDIAPGTTMGTVLGYAYPGLEDRFARGSLRREDAITEDRLLAKLARERHPYAVLSQATLSASDYRTERQAIAPWRVLLDSAAYHCGIPNRGRADPKSVLAAIEAVRSRGQLTQIVQRWTSPPLAVVVSSKSPLRGIERQSLTELFLGKRSQTPDGQSVQLVMSGGPERQGFVKTVLNREPSEYRAAWAGQELGGRRRAPIELPDAEAVRQYLQRNPNALGYIPVKLVDANLRIIYMP